MMSLKRQLRKYRDEVKMILYVFIILFAFIGYSYTQKKFATETQGSTLSSNDRIITKDTPLPTTTLKPIQPSLVVPSIIQINIYVSNTSPIYNQLSTSFINPQNGNLIYPTSYYTPALTPTIEPTTLMPSPTHTPTPTQPTLPLLSSFSGKYYNNKTLTGTPVLTRTDSRINFDWLRSSPDGTINVDIFSATWEGTINSEEAEYQITTRHDDAMRIYIDNILVHNHWNGPAAAWEVSTINLTSGSHSLKIDYWENSGDAYVYFDIRKL